jgi:NTE family protein
MPRIGVVLGGGGIVGMAYHGAVLAGLHDATGWDPRDAEIVVGTSAGAASGAELRAGLSGADMAARREGARFTAAGERLLRGLGAPPQVAPHHVAVDLDRARASFRRILARSMMRPGSVPPGVLTSLATSPGRLSASWLTHQVHWLHRGDRWPARRFWSCAVDLDHGARVVFGRDDAPPAPLGDAVAASCAIPGVFAPVRIGDGLYVDGGGWSPTNADVLAGLGLDLVVVVSPMTAAPGRLGRREDWWLRAACRRMLMGEVGRLRASATPVAIVEPDAGDLRHMGQITRNDPLDERRCPEIVRRVRASTIARVRAGALPALRLLGGADEAAA